MRLSVALIAVGLVCAAAPQDPPPAPQAPIFRAGVDVVQLEISVLDKNRKPVHGLTKTDFTVSEGGKQQDIVDVQEIVLESDPEPPVWARAVRADVATNDLLDRRLLAIVMDDLRCCWTPGGGGTDQFSFRHAISTANRFVDNLGPHDLATVALTHDAIPILHFTNDRDALRAVISRFKPLSEGGCMPQVARTHLADLVRLLAMSPEPVKAAIVLYSPIPPPYRPIPCPLPSYVIPDTGRVVTGRPVQNDIGPQPDVLGLANVPVYRLNVSGLNVDPRFGSGLTLSNPTGGRDYTGTNDLGPAVDDILDENSSYYLIGFRTSKPTVDGNYRRLEIKVPGHGDYTVRTREGYLRPKPPPKPGSRADRDPEIVRPPPSVANLLPSSDITLEATAAAFPLPDGKSAALIMTVDLSHAVIQSPLSGTEELEMRTVGYASGDPKYDIHTKTSLAVPPGVGRVSKSFPSRLDVKPDRYELWLTARDGRTNRVGGVFYDLEVPDFAANAITLSSVVIGHDLEQGATLPPALAGVVPIVPVVSRLFGQSEIVFAFFKMYQGRTTPVSPVSLAIRILDDRGVPKFSSDEAIGADRFATNRTADYRLKLPLETLSSGRYLLSVEARLEARISPKRDVPFSVR